jgi:KipI family sensor histidine kinase inhibitor
MRVVALGDSAVLVELGATIDETLNARAIALAARMRDSGVIGITDVVPAYASLAVHFDPRVLALSEATDIVSRCAAAAGESGAGTATAPVTLEIPVWYDTSTGPDLEAVADHARCAVPEVVERHAAPAYRVYMLGFLPGFPYLGRVDPRIAAPRHVSPRPRVPAGSVGIAGRQTGIYPRDSPGGWQIIGRTPLVLFDTSRTPPALLSPGDTVRFTPITESEFRRIAHRRTP